MALELQKRFSINIANVVKNSVDSVQAVRRSEQATREAEFQRAIADGLSYDEQIAIRERQLQDVRDSGFNDEDYVAKLEESISTTKKLKRFNTYRTKYASALGELSAGKINEESYLSKLQGLLNGVDDPELRLEIQNDIATAEAKVKQYHDTILDNEVRKAKYDGTQRELKSAISKVKLARSDAAMNDNEDEVTAYDETLSALQAQFSTVKIEDSITKFQTRSATRGTNPIEKLDYINDQLKDADSDASIKIGDRTYGSAREFWSLERDNYLAGNSQTFGDFFSELQDDLKNKVATDTVRFGYPTQPVLDSTLATFNDLRSRKEVAPFVSKLDITQATVMSDAVGKFASAVNDIGTNNLSFRDAEAQLVAAGSKYGVDTTGYKLQLDENLRGLVRGGVIDQNEAATMAPDVNVTLPSIADAGNKPTPGVPQPSSTAPTTPTPASGTFVVRAGDSLSKIAAENGTSVDVLTQLNPEVAQNPNLIRIGQTLRLPGAAPTAPVTPTVPEPAATPAEPTNKPTPDAAVPNTQKPTPTPTPSAPKPTPQTPTPQAPTAPKAEPITATQPTANTTTPSYKIVYGDTLSEIAAKNNTTVAKLVELNKISDPNKIYAGQTLKLQ